MAWLRRIRHTVQTKPAERKVHDLHAKALALKDAQQTTRLVIVTTDLIGIPRALRD